MLQESEAGQPSHNKEKPMPGPSDNALKHLTELSPQDWVVRGGWTAAPATLIDADIATISGATDKVIRVAGPPDWLLAVDFHSGHDIVAKLPGLLLYNSALFKRHGLRVRTLLVLLHPGADSPQLTGWYERGFSGEPFDVALRYRMVRVCEVPAHQWLSGGLGSVPLAPLGDVRPSDLPAVIAQMKQRLDATLPPRERAQLWSAAYILMGLRYERALIQRLLQGVMTMKESVTYQAILEEGMAEGIAAGKAAGIAEGRAEGIAMGEAKGRAEGEAKEARRILLLLGRDKFGEPSANVQTALNALTVVSRLEELTVRVNHAASWQELLGMAGPRRRSPR
jgi:hypothetical protein